MSWLWVDQRALVLLHEDSLAEHGGLPGLRDSGALESALARPLNPALYGLPDLAASYAVGVAKNHAFVDGNKRAAFLAMGLFLGLAQYRLATTQLDATLTMLAVAAGTLDEAALAGWIRQRTKPR
jgi:death-on-curing protein